LVSGIFDFTESANEAVLRMLTPEERGGIVVFPASAEVGADILGFTVAWLFGLYDRFKPSSRIVKAEKALTGAGFPFGASLGRRFTGRYCGPTGILFNEESSTLELFLIPKKELLKFSAALAQEMQEPLLVKIEAKGEVYFVNTGHSEL
jgi:hypothetical protein